MAAVNNADCRICVFAKAPEAGKVKTRLIPLLGAKAAAEFHAACVRKTLRTALDADLGPVNLCCAPHSSAEFFTQCASDFEVFLADQGEGNLGERMHRAVAHGLIQQSRVIVVGADCPGLTSQTFRDAAQKLHSHDAVIVPAEDGGYVLIGAHRNHHAIFAGVDWGSERVMVQTRHNLHELGWTWAELDTHWDVDRPEDYQRLLVSGLMPDPTMLMAAPSSAKSR